MTLKAPVAGPDLELAEGRGGEAIPNPDESISQPASPSRGSRVLIGVAFPTVAAGLMIGGAFEGLAGRVYAMLGGMLGIALAVFASRLRTKPVALNLMVVGGLLCVGLALAGLSGLDAVAGIRDHVSQAVASRAALRPPVPLNPGWIAIVGWLSSIVGFSAGWIALVIDRPPLGLLVPLPIAAIAGISVPEDAQMVSGIAVMALFAIGLGITSGVHRRDIAPTSLGYEARRALRSFAMIGALSVVLVLLARADFLFPQPFFDPTLEPQKPRTVPLSDVVDRVLFEVESRVSGPWRIGALDVYDGTDWRLPPYAESELELVGPSGVVDPNLRRGVRASFTIRGMEGPVLPALPGLFGILAEGQYDYDSRSGSVRVHQGQLGDGMRYTVVAAALPSLDQLREASTDVPDADEKFLEVPPPPPGVKRVLTRAPTTSKWDAFDYMRTLLLERATAVGQGVPTSVTPARVDALLIGEREGSPFEIVAAQAMIARWLGIPSRIGFGFDGGEKIDGRYSVRPRHSATWVEIYVPGFKWLPVVSVPRHAKGSVADATEQQTSQGVAPSDEIAVQLILPLYVPPPSLVLQRVRLVVLVGFLLFVLALVVYFAYPGVRKTFVRARRRAAATREGIRARIEMAYTEWRDTLTDFGYESFSDPPLMLLDRFVPDQEHSQFAWLVTRSLWGDLQAQVTDEHAEIAERLSRTLRRRLALAHPVTLRVIAWSSRLSLRQPYNVDIDRIRGKVGRVA